MFLLILLFTYSKKGLVIQQLIFINVKMHTQQGKCCSLVAEGWNLQTPKFFGKWDCLL